MEAVVTVAKLELVAIFFAILAIVAIRLLSGRIAVAGLLAAGPGRPVSPERVQLLLATLGAAGYLLLSIGSPKSREMVLPSEWLLLLFGGSHATYLITKYLRPIPPSPPDRCGDRTWR